MKKQNRKLLFAIKSTLLAWSFEGSSILSVSKSDSLLEIILALPNKYTDDQLNNCLSNLCEQTNYVEYKIIHKNGRVITVHFANSLPNIIPFKNSMLQYYSQKIVIPGSFGPAVIDFEDGASCHMLAGGAPRMGKTFSLIYLATSLYIQNKGNIDLFILSQKGRDFYPFDNIKNAHIIADEAEIENTLQQLIDMYKSRDHLLYSLPRATDSKSVKKLYPHMYKHFRSVYIIIDEYADYIGKKEIQDKVFELVRKAGYLNVHVIICTQRPEARYTVPANIKMGLMLRLCLPVTDTNNSIVVLDSEGGEKLPHIQGRAIIKDGDLHTVQLPYMSYTRCLRLLSPYKRSVSRETITNDNQENKGSTNTNVSLKISNMFQESIGVFDIPGQQQPDQHNKPGNEATLSGWDRLATPTVPRQTISIHPQPITHTPKIKQN